MAVEAEEEVVPVQQDDPLGPGRGHDLVPVGVQELGGLFAQLADAQEDDVGVPGR
ncbi:hypothetical protein AB0G49_00500 [Streptomyces longwoodensis]|uniref:hypothetical protein n=1 Tax=Streptomyces longwoodensis TaxID=68231 RepID=UPI003410F46F